MRAYWRSAGFSGWIQRPCAGAHAGAEMAEKQVDSRRLNPLVDRYVTTDLPLQAILETAPKPHTKLVRALLLLQECLGGRRLGLADPQVLVGCGLGRSPGTHLTILLAVLPVPFFPRFNGQAR